MSPSSSEAEPHKTLPSNPRRPSFRFENLEVWQRSIDFAHLVYRLTVGFPDSERYGMSNQLRRASVPVGANIAEGSGRPSNKDFAHFLDQAYGSCMEVVSLTELASRLSYIDQGEREELRAVAASIAAMVSALKRSILTTTH